MDGAVKDKLAFAQTGRIGPLVGLSLKILILNILTLTLYRFWGRTEVRRYLWGSTTINGEPLEYTGTGLELFLGFVFAMVFILLPFGGALYAIVFFLQGNPPVFAAAIGVWYIAFFLLLPFAYFRAWRYRLSRTSWRGVRFALEGSGYGFCLKSFLFYILTVLTGTLALPVADARLTNHLLRRVQFGDRSFSAEGKARSLYLSFFISFILALVAYGGFFVALQATIGFDGLKPGQIPTPGEFIVLYALIFAFAFLVQIAASFYAARRLVVFVGGWSLEGVRFSLHATALSYLSLTITNMLLILFTLGFAMPISELRAFRYLFSRLKAEGEIDLKAIVQSQAERPSRGEGLAEAFGFGTV